MEGTKKEVAKKNRATLKKQTNLYSVVIQFVASVFIELIVICRERRFAAPLAPTGGITSVIVQQKFPSRVGMAAKCCSAFLRALRRNVKARRVSEMC